MVTANGTVVYHDIPSPKSDSVPLLTVSYTNWINREPENPIGYPLPTFLTSNFFLLSNASAFFVPAGASLISTSAMFASATSGDSLTIKRFFDKATIVISRYQNITLDLAQFRR